MSYLLVAAVDEVLEDGVEALGGRQHVGLVLHRTRVVARLQAQQLEVLLCDNPCLKFAFHATFRAFSHTCRFKIGAEFEFR